jgi:phosphoserine phosphatase RsbU/P
LSEAALLFEKAACGLARTTGDGTFVHVNELLCEWVGYSGDELRGRRKLQDLLTMGGRIFHQTHWHPLLQIQGSVSEVKLELVHRDGSKLPMVMNAIGRSGPEGIHHDIALYIARDRDAYERELVHSRKKLEALVAEATRLHAQLQDRALFSEQMVGIVSHDLRNPLSTIMMGTALLSRGEATPNQLRLLGRVSRAADRANRLIIDLLDFTQARMGKGISVAPRRIDLRTAVAEVIEELALAYPGRKLVHQHEGASECIADADRLSQLIGNLVSNAMAYGEPGAAVTVVSGVDDASSGLVTVHNWGTPIPKAVEAKLFQPMVRGEGEAHSGSSVGLGLFIVAEIAKAHGGAVSVESSAERGTTFRVVFPGH